MIENIFPNVRWDMVWEATVETIYMSAISVFATAILGVMLGMILYVTAKGNLLENRVVYLVTSAYVNIFRSIPFIILIILLIPITTILVGSMLGAEAALPALIIGASPFYARMVEIALREIDRGVIEASLAMGATKWQIMTKVLLPEARPALISGITVTAIAIVSYTAMAGAVGAGGLGDLAFIEGFRRNREDVTFVATVTILLIVFVIQWIGDFFTHKTDKRI
ncbi:methionine ABC transporter permease [Bacillus solitudinis]|uniref:methionine ABC transporter permease n=1 Tax=Bacillus solitudinis TaxID=2014074 RepID=UPI000C23DF38|nr:methionine ABC transporter permease [Bacillus solitudinis]